MKTLAFCVRVRRRLECWLKGFHIYGPVTRQRTKPNVWTQCANCWRIAVGDEAEGIQACRENVAEEQRFTEHRNPDGGVEQGYYDEIP